MHTYRNSVDVSGGYNPLPSLKGPSTRNKKRLGTLLFNDVESARNST